MEQESGKILIGSDHAGYTMKEYIKAELTRMNIMFEDVGAYNEDRSDYPLYAAKVASRVASGAVKRGIIICGTGIGSSIMANRYRGVRAALCITEQMALLARQHNDANVLVMGARITSNEEAKKILFAWLNTAFEGGRHEPRLQMIDELAPIKK